ncbi:MAG: alpha/beta fold hydrolase [Anaerolineales bacterium]
MKTTHRNWQYWIRLFFATIFLLFLAAGATVVWGSYRQANAYLHPERSTANEEYLKTNGIAFQDIELMTDDGVKLSAWYTPPQNGTVILLAHGYGLHRIEEMYTLFASHGYGVMAWDFRAHGTSGGEFCSLGYYEIKDVKAALDFVLSQPGVKHIGGWGGSMGAVTMIRAAARYPQIEALVADSPFVTLKDEFDLRVPVPVLRPLIRFFAESESGIRLEQVSPLEDISKISPRPVFLIQGMDDGMVPLDSAQRLYDAAGEPRQLWTEPGVSHLNMFYVYEAEYTERVIGFFDEFLANK